MFLVDPGVEVAPVSESVEQVEQEVLEHKAESHLCKEGQRAWDVLQLERETNFPVEEVLAERDWGREDQGNVDEKSNQGFVQEFPPLLIILIPRPGLIVHFVLLKEGMLQPVNHQHIQIVEKPCAKMP